jgi:hypothetical protein
MAIPIIAAGLWSAFGGLAAKFLTDSLLKWLAWKALIITLITITLPIVLKNLVTWLFDTLMSFAVSHVSTDGLSAAAFDFSGFSGYLAFHLMIPESIAVILTALAIRFVLNFIPFVG